MLSGSAAGGQLRSWKTSLMVSQLACLEASCVFFHLLDKKWDSLLNVAAFTILSALKQSAEPLVPMEELWCPTEHLSSLHVSGRCLSFHRISKKVIRNLCL